MVHDHVSDDRGQPRSGPSTSLSPARPTPDKAGEGLLRAILGLGEILREAVGEAEDGGVMAAAERVEGFPLPSVILGGQVTIRQARVGILHGHLASTVLQAG